MSNPLYTEKPQLMLVRFEQGRGKTGVPREWVWVARDPARGGPLLDYLIEKTVAAFRASCRDPTYHGQDLMPGEGYEKYLLHKLKGGQIEKIEDLEFEVRWDGFSVTETVLTYGLPSEALARQLKRTRRRAEPSA